MSGRPGRNDPCTCGSGRKYKHCCSELDLITGQDTVLREAVGSMLRNLDPVEAEALRDDLSTTMLDELLGFVREGFKALDTLDAQTAAAVIEPLVVPLQWAERNGDLRQLLMEVCNRYDIVEDMAPWQTEWLAECAVLEGRDAEPWMERLGYNIVANPGGFWSMVGRLRYHDDERAIALLGAGRAAAAQDEILHGEVYRVGVHAIVLQLLDSGQTLEPGDPVFEQLAADKYAGDWWASLVARTTGRERGDWTPDDFAQRPDHSDTTLTRVTFLTLEFAHHLTSLGWSRQRAELARHGIFSYLVASADLRKPPMTRPKMRRKGSGSRKAPAWRPSFLAVDAEAFVKYAGDVLDQRSPPGHDIAAAVLAIGPWHAFLVDGGLLTVDQAIAANAAWPAPMTRFSRNIARLKCDPVLIADLQAALKTFESSQHVPEA